jgi:HD-GYP domain-containing protein (c-di-GMP phosphodiesterase class II)
MDSLIAAMEGLVEDIYGHVHRVSGVSISIGEILGLSAADLDRLATVGVLHDVGKLHVDTKLLSKPASLDGAETEHMQRHSLFGFAMTADLFEREISEAILFHHERFDGSGYPHGRARDEIPLLARIVAVADAYDAITSERAYQPALPSEFALQEIRSFSGTQFDPVIVEAFLDSVSDGAFESTQRLILDLAAS